MLNVSKMLLDFLHLQTLHHNSTIELFSLELEILNIQLKLILLLLS